MALDGNERKALYRNLINDPATQTETKKYSFTDWEKKLLGDEKAIGKLAQFSVGRNWALDQKDFVDRFVPELKQIAPPTPKQQPAPIAPPPVEAEGDFPKLNAFNQYGQRDLFLKEIQKTPRDQIKEAEEKNWALYPYANEDINTQIEKLGVEEVLKNIPLKEKDPRRQKTVTQTPSSVVPELLKPLKNEPIGENAPIAEPKKPGVAALPNYKGFFDSPTAKLFSDTVPNSKYKYGAKDINGPDIDCSGAVCHVLKQKGIEYDSATTNAAKLYKNAYKKNIPIEKAADGDIIAMNTEGKNIDHIGFVVRDKEGNLGIAESSSSYNGTTITPFKERIENLKQLHPNMKWDIASVDKNRKISGAKVVKLASVSTPSQTITDIAREMAFKPPVQPKMPKEEEMSPLETAGQKVMEFASGFNRALFKAPSSVVKTASELGVGVLNMLGGDMQSEDAVLYRLADKYDKWLDTSEVAKKWIGKPEYTGLAANVGSGLGQVFSMIAAGPQSASKALLSTPGVLKAVSQKMFSKPSLIAFSQVFNSEFENMKAKGESEQTAFNQGLANALATSPLENLPLINLAERLNKTIGVKLARRVLNAIQQGVEEGGQEAVQQIFSNLTNNQLVESEDNIVDWAQGIQPSAEAGGVVGLLIGALANAKAARGYARKPAAAPGVEAIPAEEVQDAGYRTAYAKTREEIPVEYRNNVAEIERATTPLGRFGPMEKVFAYRVPTETIDITPQAPTEVTPEPAVTETAPVAEEIPFEEVTPVTEEATVAPLTEEELAQIEETELTPEEEAALLAQEEVAPAAPVQEFRPELPEIQVPKPEGFAPFLRKLGYTDEEISKMTFEQQQEIATNKTEPARAEGSSKVDVAKENQRVEKVAEAQRKIDEEIAAEEAAPAEEVAPEVEGEAKSIKDRSDADIEKRMSEIEEKHNGIPSELKNKADSQEYNTLEKEMEERERSTIFDIPLAKVKDAVNALLKKEKEKPNGYGSFIESRDARETKEVADRYLNAKNLTDKELKKDFKDALFGKPTTWYADGLKLRESINEATRRGIQIDDLLKTVEKEFTSEGFDEATARKVIAGMLGPVFKGAQEISEKQLHVAPAAPAPKGRKKKEAPVTPAPAAPKKEGKKAEAKEEKKETSFKGIASFETAKGSVYTVLPDGRTQRFKTATKEQNEPQDLTVFVKFKDAAQEQDFLEGVQRSETSGTKVYVIDKQGNKYDRNEQAAGKDVRLALVKDGKVIDTAETSTTPKIGYNTFDQRRFEKDGEKYRQAHLGNKVVKINEQTKTEAATSFTSQQSSEAATAFDKAKTSKGFDKKHGKGAYKALSDITKNFDTIMDNLSDKIKQDCL